MTDYLDRVRSLLAAATPGPWVDGGNGYVETGPETDLHRFDVMPATIARTELTDNDAAFIAEAPAAVTHLLARLDAVEALIGWLEAASADNEPLYCKGKVSARATAEQLRAALTGEGE